MLLLIFAHVDAGHHVLVVEQILRQGFGKFCLAHTGGSQEDERAYRAFRVVKPGTRAAHGIGDCGDCFLLSDHAAVQFFFEVQKLLLFALHHFVHRNTGPARNHVGYIFGIDLFLDKGLLALHGLELFLDCGVLLFLVVDKRVSDFGHACIVAFAFGALGFEPQLFDIDFILLYAVDEVFLGLPFGGVFLFFLAKGCNVAFNLFYTIRHAFALYCLAFDFLLCDVARDVVESLRNGIDFEFKFGCSLVDEVDGFVGKETVGYVSFRKLYGGNDCFVADAYFVMVLIAFLKTAQDGDCAGFVGFVHHHFLESAFQSLVFLEVFLVFVEGGGAYAA